MKSPRTVRCPYCLTKRNRLSVYATGIGYLCYRCLTGRSPR